MANSSNSNHTHTHTRTQARTHARTRAHAQQHIQRYSHSTDTALHNDTFRVSVTQNLLPCTTTRRIKRYSHSTLMLFHENKFSDTAIQPFFLFRSGTFNDTHDSLSIHLLEYRPSSELFHSTPESHYIRQMPQVPGARRDTGRADPCSLQ